jgi:hypothetical protein
MNRADADRRLANLEAIATRLVQDATRLGQDIAALRRDLRQVPATSQTSQTSQTPPPRGTRRQDARPSAGVLPPGRQTRRAQKAAWRPRFQAPTAQQGDGLCGECHDPIQACRCQRRRGARA